MPRLAKIAAALTLALTASACSAQPGSLERKIAGLLERLDADLAADRQAAESELLGLAEEDPGAVLTLLPEVDRRAPASIRSAIDRLRQRIERLAVQRFARASTVELDYLNRPLDEALADIERQTGNRLRDGRAEFGGDNADISVTLSREEQPFWPAIDGLLDQLRLDIYPYGDERSLKLVDRGEGLPNRAGSAAYTGPFRVEPQRMNLSSDLRSPGGGMLQLGLGIAWEPRLRPIAISHPMASVVATTDAGDALQPSIAHQSIDLEATPGSHTLDLELSFQAPDRSVQRVESLTGSLTALLTGKGQTFRFEKIGAAKLPATQTHADATVRVERFVRNGALWELEMRLRIDQAGDSLASHRGWVFQNPSYLVDGEGNRIEHAGFENTMQTEEEIGVAYFFDLSGEGGVYFEEQPPADADAPPPIDPTTLEWVYETPTSVHSATFEYELEAMDLP